VTRPRVLITGAGAICASGMTPDPILGALREGRSAIGPIKQWDTAGWPVSIAAEMPDFDPRALVEDRKLHKMIRRTDMFGMYAASSAIDAASFISHRDTLHADAAAIYSDRSGLYVGSGGGAYNTQYEYFPLMTTRTATSAHSGANSTASLIQCGCCARFLTTYSATSASSTTSKARTPASPITAPAARWP
jgi:3-oxoacyl-(acyl-carrier-protein) synthase